VPQIQLETLRKGSESEVQVWNRLRKDAENEKLRILSQTDACRIFDSTPAMQTIGDKVILRWSYKQYPLT